MAKKIVTRSFRKGFLENKLDREGNIIIDRETNKPAKVMVFRTVRHNAGYFPPEIR